MGLLRGANERIHVKGLVPCRILLPELIFNNMPQAFIKGCDKKSLCKTQPRFAVEFTENIINMTPIEKFLQHEKLLKYLSGKLGDTLSLISNILRLIHLISIIAWLPGSLELCLMLNNPNGLNFTFYEINCTYPQF